MEENDDLFEMANYIKEEFYAYFKEKPNMLRVLKNIKVVNKMDKVSVELPIEIHNIAYMTDKFLIQRCIENGIRRYMEDNEMIGSVY